MASIVNFPSSTKSLGEEGRGNVNSISPFAPLEPPSSTSQPSNTKKTKETLLSGEAAFLYGNVLVEGPEEEEDVLQTLLSISAYKWTSCDVSEFSSFFSNIIELGDWVENNCIVKTLEFSQRLNYQHVKCKVL